MSAKNQARKLLKRMNLENAAWMTFTQGKRLQKSADEYFALDFMDPNLDMKRHQELSRTYQMELHAFLIFSKRFVACYRKDENVKPKPGMPKETMSLICGLRDLYEHAEDYEFGVAKKIEFKNSNIELILSKLGINWLMHKSIIYNNVTKSLEIGSLINLDDFLIFPKQFIDI